MTHPADPFDAMRWQPPPGTLTLRTLDMHTGGEPLRVITGGLPPLPGATVLDKRRWFRTHLDHLRTGLMWEPRGHADMYGAVLTRAADPAQADFDVFFLHNEGYSTMCGHAIIALTKLVLEGGLAPRPPAAGQRAELSFNVPAGRIEASALWQAGRAQDTRFVNVPSFVYRSGLEIDVPPLGRIRLDIAYGGAFYAIVDAAPLGLALRPDKVTRLIDAGRRIKHAVMQALPIVHPLEPELSFLYGTIFTGAPQDDPAHHSRNVCIFADGEVDRSATGSGVSARAALHFARGDLRVGDELVIESIVGSVMSVRIAGTLDYAGYPAVLPEVGGSAYVTGENLFHFDPQDPMRGGFLVR